MIFTFLVHTPFKDSENYNLIYYFTDIALRGNKPYIIYNLENHKYFICRYHLGPTRVL